MAVEGPSKTSTLTLRKPYMDKSVDGEDSSLRMSLTGGSASDEFHNLPPTPTLAGKRKQPEASRSGRFKGVAQLVVAMNRFKASLNPTYTFGKRQDSSSSGQASGWVRDTPEGTTQEATSIPTAHRMPSGEHQEPRRVYTSRGHKTDYVLQPLPPSHLETRAACQVSDGL